MADSKLAKLERGILEISHMMDGLDIAMERAREYKEKFIFNYEPFESSEPLTFSLDVLIGVLRKDKAELKTARDELRKEL